MREGDDLYFVPGVPFSAVDLLNPALAQQYEARIVGFYLDPARLCIHHGHAFAAGLLLVSAIDFMAGLHHSAQAIEHRRTVGSDFCGFVRQNLESFRSDNLANSLYSDFRNGLSHEARIKKGGEFSFNWRHTIREFGGRLCINPAYLLKEVESAVSQRLSELRTDAAFRAQAAERLRIQFAKEFQVTDRLRRAV